jgi:hypothetical protein
MYGLGDALTVPDPGRPPSPTVPASTVSKRPKSWKAALERARQSFVSSSARSAPSIRTAPSVGR